MRYFNFIKLFLILLIFSININCNKKNDSEHQEVSHIKSNNINCTQIVVKIEACAEQSSLNKRFNISKIKKWIYDECKNFKQTNPDKFIKLASCTKQECSNFENCINKVFKSDK